MVDEEYPGRIMLAEANQWPKEVVEYFGTEEEPECHMCFHFPVMPRIYYSLREEKARADHRRPGRHPADPARHGQWGTFLRNHDELTLEMVTTEERAAMYGWYAPDPRMRANVGIRRRLAPLLDNSRAEIELINALLLSLPGSPCLYYGDEIGMGDNIWLADRDAVRTPMQWTPDRNAGFSSRRPGQALPAGRSSRSSTTTTPSTSRPSWRLAAPRCCTGLRGMLPIRKRHPVFGLGRTFRWPEPTTTRSWRSCVVDGRRARRRRAPRPCCASTTCRSTPAGQRDSGCRTTLGGTRSRTCSAAAASRRSRTTATLTCRLGLAGLLLAAADPRAAEADHD